MNHDSVSTCAFCRLRQGSGKVEYQTPEAAQLAVQQLDGSELDGRQLHVTC